MFRMIVATQWKWTRLMVLFVTLIGFAIPIASLQAASGSGPRDFVVAMQRFGVAYALLAATAGLLVALAAWAHDQRGRHIYALSLPVSRARYVLMRLGAGALFLFAPIVAVLVGATLVTIFGAIPDGLTAYPFALTLRFAFAALMAYALFFSIGSSTQRTAAIVLGVLVAVLLAQYVLSVLDIRYNLLARLAEVLFTSPGIFSVFAGRWTLIDA